MPLGALQNPATLLHLCAISHAGSCGVLHLQRPAVADELDVHAAEQSIIESAGSQYMARAMRKGKDATLICRSCFHVRLKWFWFLSGFNKVFCWCCVSFDQVSRISGPITF